jgi:hypothetical protein
MCIILQFIIFQVINSNWILKYFTNHDTDHYSGRYFKGGFVLIWPVTCINQKVHFNLRRKNQKTENQNLSLLV